MMAARAHTPSLIERLPSVRGRYSEASPLSRVTWFGVGGPADVMFRPADRDDLAEFLTGKPADVPVTVIGVGSNLLVRDGGIAGVVIRLGKGFVEVTCEGERVRAGAGALDANVARTAAEAGLEGLEFYSGIPGTIGGALRMNAGAYGVETKDVLVSAEAVDLAGRVHAVDAKALGLTYRHSDAPADWIFTAAVFRAKAGGRAVIAQRMAEIAASREATQPIRSRTGGSTFKNPPGEKAWQLIERAGCRGLVRGGAMVSEKHCNFLINTGNATAAELEALGEEVRRRVRETTGITLEWEIKRVGVPR
jgi:UDP-N-acetylmuramate dehydrogenase